MKTKTGGPNGSIRFEEEYNHAANAGLKIAIDLLGKQLLSVIIIGGNLPSMNLIILDCLLTPDRQLWKYVPFLLYREQ